MAEVLAGTFGRNALLCTIKLSTVMETDHVQRTLRYFTRDARQTHIVIVYTYTHVCVKLSIVLMGYART